MPDWIEVVKARLGCLDLNPGCAEDVYRELAQHLEEIFLECRGQGQTEDQATQSALAAIPDWSDLRRIIRKTLAPSLARALFTFLGVLAILVTAQYFWAWSKSTLLSLGGLLGIGVLLAFLSKSSGGRPRDQLIAAAFPWVSFSIINVWSSFNAMFVFGGSFQPLHIAKVLLNTASVPVAVALLGGLLHLLVAERTAARTGAAGGIVSSVPPSNIWGKRAPMHGIPWLHLALAIPIFFISLGAVDHWIHGEAIYFGWMWGMFSLRISPLQLGALFLLGSILALASRHLRGSGRMQILAAITPACWFLAVLTYGELRFPRPLPFGTELHRFAGILISNSVVPGLAMALGALVVILLNSPRFLSILRGNLGPTS